MKLKGKKMSEIIRIDRDTIIKQLIDSTFNHIEQCPETLDEYLKYGFKGFENYSDFELLQEYRDYISEDASADIEIIMEEENVSSET
jgi:hypothetical protein